MHERPGVRKNAKPRVNSNTYQFIFERRLRLFGNWLSIVNCLSIAYIYHVGIDYTLISTKLASLTASRMDIE